MAEHQTTSESSADLMQLQALRQQGIIGASAFAQLKAKLLSGNAQDVKGAQQDIHNLQQPAPRKKGSGWLFKSFMVAIIAVIVTIVYLVMNLPKGHDDELNARHAQDEQVEILLPKGAQDVVPTFTPGQSINEAFKARQAAQDGLLARDDDGNDDTQVATSAPSSPAPALMQPNPNNASGNNVQKAANPSKEPDPINQLLKKQQEAQAKPTQKKAPTSENIDNLF
ncbi:MAG: hypothetical protein KBC57_09515 [Neisseriaceae bacterium]|nr:hypothetical protein [Neisseriaceae bacterium]MBP6862581.1 hypothetical protein [Neisseriaceae bacterium]